MSPDRTVLILLNPGGDTIRATLLDRLNKDAEAVVQLGRSLLGLATEKAR